jgi:hypothetical protein
MVNMNEADLQDKGVAAQGARNKVSPAAPADIASSSWHPSHPLSTLRWRIAGGANVQFLKVFYNVREKMDIPHPPGSEQYAPGKDDK